jgi:hypothetical protein
LIAAIRLGGDVLPLREVLCQRVDQRGSGIGTQFYGVLVNEIGDGLPDLLGVEVVACGVVLEVLVPVHPSPELGSDMPLVNGRPLAPALAEALGTNRSGNGTGKHYKPRRQVRRIRVTPLAARQRG